MHFSWREFLRLRVCRFDLHINPPGDFGNCASECTMDALQTFRHGCGGSLPSGLPLPPLPIQTSKFNVQVPSSSSSFPFVNPSRGGTSDSESLVKIFAVFAFCRGNLRSRCWHLRSAF